VATVIELTWNTKFQRCTTYVSWATSGWTNQQLFRVWPVSLWRSKSETCKVGGYLRLVSCWVKAEQLDLTSNGAFIWQHRWTRFFCLNWRGGAEVIQQLRLKLRSIGCYYALYLFKYIGINYFQFYCREKKILYFSVKIIW
jgi:hypothetical protein